MIAPEEIGLGIIRYSGSDLDTIATLSVSGYRFLDVLWLPVPLSRLSTDQIRLINRFRESSITMDAQFSSAKRARGAYISIAKAISVSSILEIGCGKFPICIDIALRSYAGIEIDLEAIEWCRSAGINVATLDDFKGDSSEGPAFQFIIACYVFHFAISDRLIEKISELSASDGIMIFNIIADEVKPILEIISRMLGVFSQIEIIKTSDMPRREYWIIMSGLEGVPIAGKAKKVLTEYYKERFS